MYIKLSVSSRYLIKPFTHSHNEENLGTYTVPSTVLVTEDMVMNKKGPGL